MRTLKDPLVGSLVGVAGGLAGVFAMGWAMQRATRIIPQKRQEEQGRQPAQKADRGSDDSMSLIGVHHQPGEGSTEAIGRIVYHGVTRRDPSRETKQWLGDVVHWGYGAVMGAAYGMVRARSRGDLCREAAVGAAFGTGMWAIGDELAVPALGLSDKPTTKPISMHAQYLIGHLGYGAAVGATVAVLRGILRVLGADRAPDAGCEPAPKARSSASTRGRS